MKDWEPDHPKAKLMARKRAAILEASKESFLRYGYEATSMESIAAMSGISIMTLYRHAENKDDLFSTVIASACSEEEKSELVEMLASRPLDENLSAAALVIQRQLTHPDTVALLRAVIGEVARFPHLADLTYRSTIGHFAAMVEKLLDEHEESRDWTPSRRHERAEAFVDRLVGADVLRALLGLGAATEGEQNRRATAARNELLYDTNSETD